MKKLFNLFLLLTGFYFFISCLEEHPAPYFVENNSGKSIFYYLGVAPPSQGGFIYPDTSIYLDSNERLRGPVLPNSISSFSYRNNNNADTICLFIFDADTVKKYSWEEVRRGYKILQRYDMSKEDLKFIDCNFIYPPSEKMKDIKMFPPYKKQ